MRHVFSTVIKLWTIASVFTMLSVHPVSAYEQETDALSQRIAEKIAAAKRTSIAVINFTNIEGQVTALGRFLAKNCPGSLSGKIQGVKDRGHLRSILKEQKLATTGLIDPATAQQLGKIAGVEALITGILTPVGDNMRLAVKILDTTTADVLGAETANIPITNTIQNLDKKGVITDISSESEAIRPSTEESFQWIKFPARIQLREGLKDADGKLWYEWTFDDTHWIKEDGKRLGQGVGVGWDGFYRTHFSMLKAGIIYLNLSVDDSAEIYINEELVGEYNARMGVQTVVITESVKVGENLLAIHLYNSGGSSSISLDMYADGVLLNKKK